MRCKTIFGRVICLTLAILLFLLSGCDQMQSFIDENVSRFGLDPGDGYNASDDFRRSMEELEASLTKPIVLPAPMRGDCPVQVAPGATFTVSWGAVQDAGYTVNAAMDGETIVSIATPATSISITAPDKEGFIIIQIAAQAITDGKALQSDSLVLMVAVLKGAVATTEKAQTKGKVIFLQHGLNDGLFLDDSGEKTTGCFTMMVNGLCSNANNKYNRYIDFGYISKRVSTTPNGSNNKNLASSFSIMLGKEYLSMFQYLFPSDVNSPEKRFADMVDTLTDAGYNVLIRTEFSKGNLSFDEQLKQLSNMVALFDGHSANVVFIGHSMGGLASINYGVDYADWNADKKIQIITVDTPYLPNEYAKMAYDDPGFDWSGVDGALAGASVLFLRKVPGEAHRDLGGKPIEKTGYVALDGIRDKWNRHVAKDRGAKLYAIAVSINKCGSGDYRGIGDGVVDIYSQQGNNSKGEPVWTDVDTQDVIYGNSTWNWSSLQATTFDGKDPYHHCNMPQLESVWRQIDDIISKQLTPAHVS